MINFIMNFAQTCQVQQQKWGIPTWYKYLDGAPDPTVPGSCAPLWGETFASDKLNGLLGIGLALGEILLRVAAIVAVAYIIYGGFQYLVSQGEPDRTKRAKDSILNALIGLVIAILANVIVVFIGSRLTS